MKKTILASMLAVMMATPAFAAESTDIVIIGSGGAGLSSAITATEKGAKVIDGLLRRQLQPLRRRNERRRHEAAEGSRHHGRHAGTLRR